ncbi:hypothetical protein BpHYR1_035621 [Brachionus plicatilis]|uniref:Uncharacterized protein n=1 Tax=Brachionus plicatilis TaxID=10195 RepID=A0A3M7RQ24_BRAPC|nr:hypothetical protein BpHYR1_035621 [Brachionus plicatilis]
MISIKLKDIFKCQLKISSVNATLCNLLSSSANLAGITLYVNKFLNLQSNKNLKNTIKKNDEKENTMKNITILIFNKINNHKNVILKPSLDQDDNE